MLKGLIKNLRVKHWPAYFGMGLLGFFSLQNLPKFLVPLSTYLGFSFAVNNVCDVENDEGSKKNPIITGELSMKVAILECIFLFLLGMLSCYFWFPKAFPVYSLLMFLSFVYSARPIRLKTRPILDLLSHAFFFGALIVLFGNLCADREPNFYFLLAVATCSMAFELRNHLEDYEEDERAGVRTSTVFLGKENSKKLLYIFFASHLIILFLLNPLTLTPYLLLFFPLKTFTERFDYSTTMAYLLAVSMG